MKSVKLLFAIIFLFVTSALAQDMQYVSSQRGDTLVVKDDIEFGDINTLYLLMASDSLAPASRVYVLKMNGIYSLENNPVTSPDHRTVIMGENEGSVKTSQGAAPPIISGAYTTDVNTSGGINVSKDLLIKNVDLELGNSQGNNSGWVFFNLTGPGMRLQVDNCIMEHTWWTWVAGTRAGSRIFFTNDYIVNLNGYPCRRNGGVADFLAFDSHQDTLLVENCTHVNTQGSLYRLRLGFPVNRVIFNHNNFIDNAGYIIMNNGNVANMSVTNNIYVNCQLQAYCPVLSYADIGEVDEDGLPMGLINLRDDSTFQVNGASFYADRNLAYWDPSLSDIVSTLNSNEVNGSTEWVSQMITMNSRTIEMFDDNATYPRVTNGKWYNQLPNFADTDVLFTDQLAVLKAYAIAAVDTTYGYPLASWRQPDNPEASYFIYADWPIPIDLSYDDADLLNAGLGGFPLGDLNWFPTEYEAWEIQRTAEYSRITDILLTGRIEFNSNFGADITEGKIPLTVEFTDSSTGTVASWLWDFENDGIVDSYDQNPTWTFLEADTYSVKLIVSNSSILSDTLVKENYIVAYFDSIPNLYSIEDIPDDQGGWINVNFARSLYDTDSLDRTEFYSIEMNDGSGWASLIDTSASAQNVYSILVPTPFDSNAYSNGLLNFRVIANMNEGTFVSDSLQGYSVDNIFPAIPQKLSSRLTDDLNAELNWSYNPDIDFSHFLLHRSTAGSSLELFKTLTDTFYTDSSVVLDNSYTYAVQSVDSSGNKSELSDIVEILIDNPPQISALPSISFNEDDSLAYSISDWYPYISDPEHPDSVLMIDIISNDNIFSKLENDHFIFKAKENWNGSDSLTFILSDGTLSDSTMLHFNIIPVNDPPQIVDLPDSISFTVDTTVVLTMNEYAFDVDSPDSLLKWNFESKSDSVVTSYDSVSTRLTVSSLNYIGESILKCIVTDGNSMTADSIFLRINPATFINNQLYSGIPDNYVLFQNYPNPFNPSTTIRYGLKKSSKVNITIYDNLGRKVIELVNTRQEAGYHQAIWNGKNYLNQQVSSGIYFYRLKAENFTAIKRMVFIK